MEQIKIRKIQLVFFFYVITAVICEENHQIHCILSLFYILFQAYSIIPIIYYFQSGEIMNNNFSPLHANTKKKQTSNKRINRSPPPKEQQNIQSASNHNQSQDFHFKRYPFQSFNNSSNSLLRTTLSCQIDKMQLQRLIRITHPNLINIRKIIRGQPKDQKNSITQNYFSFYYENVVYSLRKVASMAESSPLIMKSIQAINFKTILSNLTEYLIDNEINHKISLDDIGINQSLQIKIYLSPFIACSIQKQQITHLQVYKNNQNLVSWWKTTFSVGQNPSHYLNLPQESNFDEGENGFNEKEKSDKSSCILHEDEQDYINTKNSHLDQKYRPLSFSIDRSYEPLNSFIQRKIQSKSREKVKQLKYSQKTLASNTNLQQNPKIKKIHQQIRNIKKRVQKATYEYRFRKQSDETLVKQGYRMNSKQRNEIGYPQMINNYNYEPIQQNINCINIYTQSGSKGKALKSVKSYNLIPLVNNRHSINHISHKHIGVEKYMNNSQSDQSFHMEQNIIPSYRHTLQPREGSSKLNFKSHDKPSYSPSSHIRANNQTIGPINLKSIINKAIKPQFVPKKSNIYEDPCEDQSDLSQSRQDYKQNINQRGYIKKNEVQNLKNLIAQCIKKAQSKDKKEYSLDVKISKQTTSIEKKNLIKKPQSSLAMKCKQMQMLNERVKQVLLRSKNTIQQLNQGKSSKIVSKKYQSPQKKIHKE